MPKTLKALLAPKRAEQAMLTADSNAVSADGKIQPIVVTKVVLMRTDDSQVAPAQSSYAVAAAGNLYSTAAISESLEGIYTASYQDVSDAVGALGFFAVGAADGDCWYATTHAEALSLLLAMADEVLEDDAGTRKKKTYARGTTTDLIPAKTAKQPDGSDLTDPTTQRLAGYQE